jgi:hypothetical protein
MSDRFVCRASLYALVLLCLAAPVVVLRAQERATGAEAAAPTGGDAKKPTDVSPDAEPEGTEFLRYVDDEKHPRLESAIATYRNDAGVVVHLVGAVHVGEKSYYEGLNKTFKGYDALLYEMVKPKDMAAPVRGQKTGSAVSGFQRFLTDVLELEFQLDGIDYGAPNFVHADLDVETFYKLQEERGESLLTLMLRSMMAQMARAGQAGGPPPITIFDLLAAMNSPDSARQYKLLLARQFQDIEAQMAGLEGPDGSVLLTERNKAALRVLKETIEKGKKDVGVFYGAGHMHGLEEALVNDMGFKLTGVEWRVAWDMTPSEAPKSQPARKPAPVGKGAPVGAR